MIAPLLWTLGPVALMVLGGFAATRKIRRERDAGAEVLMLHPDGTPAITERDFELVWRDDRWVRA